MTTCVYHCRTCGGHFTSLRAFDAHREGPAGSDRACTYPDAAGLVERTGTCNIVNPASVGVTIHEHPSAEQAREAFAARKAEAA